MKIPAESNEAFSIAIVGSWNPAIFTPQWAKENLSDDVTRDVMMAYSFPLVPMPPRLTVDDVNIYPSSQYVMFDGVVYDDSTCKACSEKVQKICQLLPHTPTTAIGINFRFHATLDESELLAELLTFADAGKIDANKYTLQSSAVKRSFKLGGSDTLNLSVEFGAELLRLDFNFQTDVTNLLEAAASATAIKIIERKELALEMLATVYGLEAE